MKIYNTLTQRKEEFVPLKEGKVKIYVCGITTYDFCHLGHGRMLVAFDVITRYLRAKNFDVTYVRNITDIDDKILNRSAENGELYSDLTNRFITAMHEDCDALGMAPPDEEPRATAYIEEIIALIQQLVDKDFAYRAENGDVYYAVANFPEYGKLSKKNPEELLAGARIGVGELKRDPRDFALWKSSPDDGVGWDSPWGYGRPGWHIECSAMSMCCLGDTFDIHGGGSDLMFPHHENEIAQSEAVSEKALARLWMHNGPLRIDNEKMSKSLGNFFTIREVLEKFDAEVIRYLLISSQYRSPINYSDQSLAQASSSLERLYTAIRGLDINSAKTLTNSQFEKDFYLAMDDDFNTPEAFSVLFDLAREINRQKTEDLARAGQLAALLVRLASILGLLQRSAEDFLQNTNGDEVDSAQIDQLIIERNAAREAKDWAKADEIRDRLAEMKVVIEDSARGTGWRIER